MLKTSLTTLTGNSATTVECRVLAVQRTLMNPLLMTSTTLT